jgi:hypothetical protein
VNPHQHRYLGIWIYSLGFYMPQPSNNVKAGVENPPRLLDHYLCKPFDPLRSKVNPGRTSNLRSRGSRVEAAPACKLACLNALFDHHRVTLQQSPNTTCKCAGKSPSRGHTPRLERGRILCHCTPASNLSKAHIYNPSPWRTGLAALVSSIACSQLFPAKRFLPTA